jgi:hypothetical protein
MCGLLVAQQIKNKLFQGKIVYNFLFAIRSDKPQGFSIMTMFHYRSSMFLIRFYNQLTRPLQLRTKINMQ